MRATFVLRAAGKRYGPSSYVSWIAHDLKRVPMWAVFFGGFAAWPVLCQKANDKRQITM